MNRATFFAAVRGSLFSSLSTSQVSGTEALLDAFADARWPLTHAAYGLATAYHETARTMQPIAEYGRGKGRKYGVKTRYGSQVAYGRGYVQLTWYYNYEKADKALGLSGALLRDFDLAMRPDIASAIMVRGMTEGWFTGKANGDYLDRSPPDYSGARRIINGTDKAETIASYARSFEKALAAGGWGTQEPTEAPPVTPKLPVVPKTPSAPQPPSEPQQTPPSFWSRFWASLVSRMNR